MSSTSGGRRSARPSSGRRTTSSCSRERGLPRLPRAVQRDRARVDLRGRPGEAPWGGLPEVSLFVTQVWTDSHLRIAEAWTRERGVPFFALEKAVDQSLPERWWERIAHDWEEVVGTARLDLMTAELERLIAFLEDVDGPPLRRGAIRAGARARERAAGMEPPHARPRRRNGAGAVRHRRQHPGGDAARSGTAAPSGRETPRAASTRRSSSSSRAGASACPDERLRLMWIGRGLWFNLGFYQHFQEQYGAVFVWSMYLAIAADGYPRYGGDPLRSLAARFAAFTDLIGMPGWADEWYLKEARLHGVDGVVHLVVPGLAEQLLRHPRARAGGHPGAGDRRRQRRRARVGRAGLRRRRCRGSSRRASSRRRWGGDERGASGSCSSAT